MIKRGDILVIKGEGYKKAVLGHLLEKFKDKLMIKIIASPPNCSVSPTLKKNVKSKTAVIDTIDTGAYNIINILINNKTAKLTELSPRIKKNKIIKPLYLFLDEEVLLYAKLKGLTPKLTPRGVPSSNKKKDTLYPKGHEKGTSKGEESLSEEGKEKKNKISEFINELEKKHPEVKRAIVNGYLKIEN